MPTIVDIIISMSSKYIFRADGNARIGLGHIMRSLTIADALMEKVGRDAIIFACADEGSADIARQRGFFARSFNTDFTRMEDELSQWQYLTDGDSIILVDSYQVTDEYLKALKQYGRVVYMDDMQNHTYPVDAVINYNIFADRDKYKELYGSLDNCYLGCEYIPVRPQFTDSDYEVKEQISNVLITMGGADFYNIAGAVYSCLHDAVSELADKNQGRSDKLPGISDNVKFHVISGMFSPGYEVLKQKEKESDDIVVYHDVTDMAGLMKQCDLAITAGGSTVYELASLGLPFICLSYADNQEPAVDFIGKKIAVNAGAYNKDAAATMQRVKETFFEQYSDYEYRKEAAKREREVVDGKGATRIAERLIALAE